MQVGTLNDYLQFGIFLQVHLAEWNEITFSFVEYIYFQNPKVEINYTHFEGLFLKVHFDFILN